MAKQEYRKPAGVKDDGFAVTYMNVVTNGKDNTIAQPGKKVYGDYLMSFDLDKGVVIHTEEAKNIRRPYENEK